MVVDRVADRITDSAQQHPNSFGQPVTVVVWRTARRLHPIASNEAPWPESGASCVGAGPASSVEWPAARPGVRMSGGDRRTSRDAVDGKGAHMSELQQATPSSMGVSRTLRLAWRASARAPRGCCRSWKPCPRSTSRRARTSIQRLWSASRRGTPRPAYTIPWPSSAKTRTWRRCGSPAPNRFHCEHTVMALEHGKHVIVEKPMAVFAARGGADDRGGGEERRGSCWRGHTNSFELPVRAMRRVILSGELGPPLRRAHLVVYGLDAASEDGRRAGPRAGRRDPVPAGLPPGRRGPAPGRRYAPQRPGDDRAVDAGTHHARLSQRVPGVRGRHARDHDAQRLRLLHDGGDVPVGHGAPALHAGGTREHPARTCGAAAGTRRRTSRPFG